jgi:hypothetical protein
VVDAWTDALCAAWGVASPTHPELRAPWMRLVPLPIQRALPAAELDAIIVAAREHAGAEVAITAAGDRTYLRLSAFLYNDASDLAGTRLARLSGLADLARRGEGLTDIAARR